MVTELRRRKFVKVFRGMDANDSGVLDRADILLLHRRFAEHSGWAEGSAEAAENRAFLLGWWAAFAAGHRAQGPWRARSRGAARAAGVGAICVGPSRAGPPGGGGHRRIALPEGASFVLLAHLQAGSIRVSVGQEVKEGQQIANCGNSGNSTQPHLHMQVIDSADPLIARGMPMAFRRFREWPGDKQFKVRERGIPGEGAVVEPLPLPPTADASSGWR